MKTFKKTQFASLLLVLLLTVMTMAPVTASAAETTVNLRSTSTFAILAGTEVTNTGATTITGGLPEGGGNVGVHDGTSFTGQSTVVMTGWNVYLSDIAGVALQAKNDLILAYDDAASRTPTTTFVESDNQLGGKTLTAGVYRFGHADTANLTAGSPLILDAEGDPNAVFIFQATSDLVTASGSVIELRNGARYCRVFWQVASSATLGTNSTFKGHIFALTSITASTGATIQGQLLARNGAVVLQANTITNGLCETIASSSSSSSSSSSTGGTLPDTSTPWYTLLLVGAVIAFIGAYALKRKNRKE